MPMIPTRTLNLCECCALVVASGDDSSCRDYHGHTHQTADVPASTVLAGDPHTWDGITPLDCHGCGEPMMTGAVWWIAEVLANVREGDSVRILPHTDWFMGGVRFGTVKRFHSDGSMTVRADSILTSQTFRATAHQVEPA